MQFVEGMIGAAHLMSRSMFGMVRVQNKLPTNFVGAVRFLISKPIDGVGSQSLPAVNGPMVTLFQRAARRVIASSSANSGKQPQETQPTQEIQQTQETH